ncbi:MAG TPA: ABC transporter permease [Methylomusa anaerophila]|uniref:Putative aliphatic sulfonates transport permease protein SsuC n=1 Tax=Methylomusa anaerophila TaxID=1930071 RepID=A0A348AQR0_9FIRM|nr:ABC transporter permease [Methylomusa anaerophila]BBB93408.1 putative aliphatic sulfonates transport permease protein SsuC [Methylomusa anaerophila]HML90672.1 ABC transporter permease [Methylomusa anaerophila]
MTEKMRDRLILLGLVLALWELITGLKLLDPLLYPSPQTVFKLIIEDRDVFTKSLVSSFNLLFYGCLLALVTAIPLGLIVGWNRRLYSLIEPVMNILGPIPPIVYIPYAVAILPTFKMSSAFIIFVGAFWPLFINTVSGVQAVEQGIINSARTLGVGYSTMLLRILLPGAMPHILTGGTISLVMAFILLAAAEMIGATSGLGWYIKYFADFADYHRVVAGILVMGAVVFVLMIFYNRLAQYLLRWKLQKG